MLEAVGLGDQPYHFRITTEGCRASFGHFKACLNLVYCEALTRETRDLVQGIIDRFDVRFVESGPFKAQ